MTLSSSSNEVSFFVKQPAIVSGGTAYTVSVTIQKQDISGVSKFEVNLPAGFAIRAIETSGSRFVEQSNIGKFIWLSLPNKESVRITYQVYIPANVLNYKIENTFYYLEANKKISSTFSSFYETELITQNFTLQEINTLLLKYDNKDIYFKVQLGAYQKILSVDNIPSYFLVESKVDVCFTDGFYKYSVGPFLSYSDALAFQENCNVKGAFLVLYFIDMKVSNKEAAKIIQH